MVNRWMMCARLVVFVVGIGLVNPMGTIAAQTLCTAVEQLTTGDEGSFEASTDGAGRYVAFYSNNDLVAGGNPDLGTEIFVYDHADGSLVQVTDVPMNALFNTSPDMADDGSLVAFRAEGDIVMGGNPETNSEIYTYETATGDVDQVTMAGAGADSFAPRVSGDGGRLVIASVADLVPGGNLDANLEIYWYDVTGTVFQQVTDSSGLFIGNGSPDISADGQWIVFSSNANLVSGGNLDSNNELFLYEIATETTMQLTDTMEGLSTLDPVISADGSTIAFLSDRDLTGDNPTGNNEIFLYHRGSQTFEQITSDPSAFLQAPAISADGRRVAFGSFRFGGGPSTWEVMLYDGPSQTLGVAVSDGSSGSLGGITPPDLNADGTVLVFDTRADVTGVGGDPGLQIYRAVCPQFFDGFESGGTAAWDTMVP